MTTWNPKGKRPEQILASATGIETVTPSDTVGLTTASLGLYVGVAGDVSVVMLDGTTGLFKAVPAGTLLPIQITRVNATLTTATTMVSIN
jgi:hypothetical protein